MWWGHKLLLGFGLLLLSAGLYLGYSTYTGVSKTIGIEGTVVSLEQHTNGAAIYPVIHFMDLDGHEHAYISNTGSNEPSYYPGEKVRILFNPNSPDSKETTRIDGFAELWGATLFLLGMGSVFVLLTLFVSYLMRLDDGGEDTVGGDTVTTVINFFLLTGVIVFTLGIYSWSTTYSFVAKAEKVKGKVIALRSFTASRYVKYPVVRYTDHLGKAHTLYSPAGSSQPYDVGDKVTVLLDTTRPDYVKTATIDNFFDLWGMATILMAIGGVFIMFTSVFKYVDKRGGEIVLLGKQETDRDLS